jgi:hypothetical protein
MMEQRYVHLINPFVWSTCASSSRFDALFIVTNHCFSLVYLQCPKGSKDPGKKCDGDEDCCNRDDPTNASLVCHCNSLFDKECTQFTGYTEDCTFARRDCSCGCCFGLGRLSLLVSLWD